LGGFDDQIEADEKGNDDDEARHRIVFESRCPHDFQCPADQHIGPGTVGGQWLLLFFSAHRSCDLLPQKMTGNHSITFYDPKPTSLSGPPPSAAGLSGHPLPQPSPPNKSPPQGRTGRKTLVLLTWVRG